MEKRTCFWMRRVDGDSNILSNHIFYKASSNPSHIHYLIHTSPETPVSPHHLSRPHHSRH